MIKFWPISSTNDVYLTKVDNVNSQLVYQGQSYKQNALDSEAVWCISRTSRNGTVTTTEYADGGAFTQVWNNRYNLFPPANFLNSYSALLNGIDGNISFGNNLTYNTGYEWSISIWFKAQNLAARRTLFAKVTNDSNVYGIGIYLETDGKIFIQTRASGALAAYTSTNSFVDDVWNNFTLTYSGSGNQNGYRLYFNGVVGVTPSSAILGNITNTEYARIGIRNGSFPFSGNLDEVSFWTKALSASEVSQLYNNGSPILLTSHSASSYLDHYYRCGDGDNTIIYDNKYSVNGALVGGATLVQDVP